MKFLTISEVAAILQLKQSTIRHYVFTKKIPFKKIGKHIRFEESEIIAWVKKITNNNNYQ